MALGKKKSLHQAAAADDGYFETVLYTGNGTSQSISTVGFQPDFVWIKQRSGTGRNVLTDSVRGAEKILYSELSGGETVYAGRGLTSFDSNGFTVDDTGAINYSVNHSGTYVAWCWKAAGAAVSGTGTGGATSVSYSANTASGFSIVKYTKSSTSGTMTHGLSAAPELIIEKRTDGTAYWNVRVEGVTGNNQTIYLNQTTEVSTHPSLNLWSTPTTSVFGYDSANATAGDYVAYCFHSVTGVQKIGTYQGTGVSGISVTTGFQPKFIIVKATSRASAWLIMDTVRDTVSPMTEFLVAQTNGAEFSASALGYGFNSTGFTVANTDGTFNDSGETYFYLAIA